MSKTSNCLINNERREASPSNSENEILVENDDGGCRDASLPSSSNNKLIVISGNEESDVKENDAKVSELLKRTIDEESDSISNSEMRENTPDAAVPVKKIKLTEDGRNDNRDSTNSWVEALAAPSTSKDSDPAFIPKAGTLVSPTMTKRAGPYLLGPLIGSSPVKSIVQCLARKVNTNKVYTIKMLMIKDNNEIETQDDRQGKMLLHSEYSLLSLLHNQDGVVHHHGFFKVSTHYYLYY